MTPKEDIPSLRQRLADFSAQFEETLRPGVPKRRPPGGGSVSDLVQGLRDLFTQGVTREGMRDLIRRDARETFDFYTRGIDFKSFQPLPWFKRYPAIAWRLFVALAYKLSPPRRIAFAVAYILGLVGWIQLVLYITRWGPPSEDSGALWLFLSFGIIFLLLLMELRDKLDLKGDLEIAREIQFGLVPQGPFQHNGTSIHCYMRPANTVGGDYYDIMQLTETRVGIVVGDVAGKGMPAALMMALLQGSLRTLITAGHRGAELMTKLNEYLCANIPENKLVTLFYGELDTKAGELRYVNAGHNAPVLIRGGLNLERLPATSLVMGIDRNTPFEERQVELRSGDRLLLFTDGVTEAFNLKDEEYGEARLTDFLQRNAALSSDELIKAIVGDVLKFCGAARPGDDMTLMAITR
ncbi:MAG TPA: PP2C family protein-serine/threonine phosphatase [Acidobacteriota bacterium]|nr:PP2C family protein-serine/threonine phosphatase [Acidobacteriota bacterium]